MFPLGAGQDGPVLGHDDHPGRGGALVYADDGTPRGHGRGDVSAGWLHVGSLSTPAHPHRTQRRNNTEDAGEKLVNLKG
ncbi:hypothetical protein GCM10009670_09600 [Citricoccus alkalitolerans]